MCFLCSHHMTPLCVSHTLFAHSCVHILLDKCNLLARHRHFFFSSLWDNEFHLKLGSGFGFDDRSILKQRSFHQWLSRSDYQAQRCMPLVWSTAQVLVNMTCFLLRLYVLEKTAVDLSNTVYVI